MDYAAKLREQHSACDNALLSLQKHFVFYFAKEAFREVGYMAIT